MLNFRHLALTNPPRLFFFLESEGCAISDYRGRIVKKSGTRVVKRGLVMPASCRAATVERLSAHSSFNLEEFYFGQRAGSRREVWKLGSGDICVELGG